MSKTVEECVRKMKSEGRVKEGKTAGELFTNSVAKAVSQTTRLPNVTEQKSDFYFVTPLSQEFVLDVLSRRILAIKSEKEGQDCVVELAWAFGWKVIHFRKVLVKMGERVHYETPYNYDGEGTPDLEFIRERMVKAELKYKSRPSKEQLDRIDDYRAAGVEVYLWRLPQDWDKVVKVLSPVPIRELNQETPCLAPRTRSRRRRKAV